MNKWILSAVLFVSVLFIGLLALMLWVLPTTLVLFTLGLLVLVILPLLLLCRQDLFNDEFPTIKPAHHVKTKSPPLKR